MNKFVALVGMCGSGKSEVAEEFTKAGYKFFRFGQITLDIVKKRGLDPTEENERPIREEVREKHGMGAYAILNMPKIDGWINDHNVLGDGLYSWEEYVELKKKYGDQMYVIAVYASPKVRYARLSGREWDPEKDPEMKNRPATPEQSKSRDYAEIENLHKAGPIAMADFTIINENVSLEELKKQAAVLVKKINEN